MTDENNQHPSQLTDRDAEQLSAYLDDMLTTDEKTEIETRLKQDMLLQRELDAMQHTVEAIRALPTLKAPRDFTLDTAQRRLNSAAKSNTQTVAQITTLPRSRRRWPQALAAVVTLVLVGLAAVVLTDIFASEDTTPPAQVASVPTETMTHDPPPMGMSAENVAPLDVRTPTRSTESLAPQGDVMPEAATSPLGQNDPQALGADAAGNSALQQRNMTMPPERAAPTGSTSQSERVGPERTQSIAPLEAASNDADESMSKNIVTVEATAEATAEDLLDELAEIGPSRRLQNVFSFLEQLADSIRDLFQILP